MIFEGKQYPDMETIPMVDELKNACNNVLPSRYFNWKQNILDCKQYHRQCRKNKITGMKSKRKRKSKKDSYLYKAFPETQLLFKGIGEKGKHGYVPASDYVRCLFENGARIESTLPSIDISDQYLDNTIHSPQRSYYDFGYELVYPLIIDESVFEGKKDDISLLSPQQLYYDLGYELVNPLL